MIQSGWDRGIKKISDKNNLRKITEKNKCGTSMLFLDTEKFQIAPTVKQGYVRVEQSKRTPIYLKTYRYILITFNLLKETDLKRIDVEKFLPKQLHMPELSTLKNLVDLAREQENIPKRWLSRLWLPEKQLNPQKLYKLIQSELKPCSVATYKIQGAGKRLENLDAKISQVLEGEDGYFIVQTRSEDEKFVFVMDNEGRCEGCNHFAVLDFPCGCQKVKYCSKACKKKDKKYHTLTCKSAKEKQLNKKVHMAVHEDNRHGPVNKSQVRRYPTSSQPDTQKINSVQKNFSVSQIKAQETNQQQNRSTAQRKNLLPENHLSISQQVYKSQCVRTLNDTKITSTCQVQKKRDGQKNQLHQLSFEESLPMFQSKYHQPLNNKLTESSIILKRNQTKSQRTDIASSNKFQPINTRVDDKFYQINQSHKKSFQHRGNQPANKKDKVDKDQTNFWQYLPSAKNIFYGACLAYGLYRIIKR